MSTHSLRQTDALSVIAGFVVLVVCAAATTLDALPVLAGITALALLAAASYRWPGGMLLALLVFSILVPVDLALRIGDLPRLGPTRLLVMAFLLGWGARALMHRDLTVSARLPLVGPMLLYLVTTLISAAGSIDFVRSGYTIASLVLEQFLFFYIFVQQAERATFRRNLVTALSVATGAVCALALFEAVTHANPIYLIYPDEVMDYRAGLLRVRSTFYHPIALGCYLTLVLPFLLFRTLTSRGLARILAAALVLLGLVTLVLTFSRGPWLAFGLQLVILMVWWTRRRATRIVMVAATGAATLGILLMAASTFDPVGHLIESALNPNRLSISGVPEESSEYYRVALFQAVIDRLAGARWLLGFGPGTFFLADVASSYAGDDHVLTAADSHFLRLLFEQGLLGVGGFAVLMTAVTAACVRAVRHSPPSGSSLPLAALAAVLGFLLENTTVSMFYLLPLELIFWAAVALALAPTRRASGAEHASTRSAPRPR